MFVRMGVVPSSENAGTLLCCDGRVSMASGDGGNRVMAGVPWDDSERELCLISDFPGRLDSLHREVRTRRNFNSRVTAPEGIQASMVRSLTTILLDVYTHIRDSSRREDSTVIVITMVVSRDEFVF
jgi:hypothetical protein